MDTKEKIRVIHMLLAKAGLMRSKYDILKAYDVESSSDLTGEQMNDLITRLNEIIKARVSPDKETRRWRSNVLTQINRCGVYVDNGDWARVNAFLLNPRISGKLLYEMNQEELKKLNRKLRLLANKLEEQRNNQLMYKTTKN